MREPLLAITNFRVSFYRGYSVWTALLVLIVCGVAAALFYRRTFTYLGTRVWVGLLSLRLGVIFLLVVLLFRPVFSYQYAERHRAHLMVLVDTSQSMEVADSTSKQTRLAEAVQRLKPHLDTLGEQFLVHLFQFDKTIRKIESGDDMDTLEPKGKATYLARCVEASTQQVKKGLVGGVLLVTDGVDNSGSDPVGAIRKLNVRVHCVGTGYDRRNPNFKDISVESVECPDELTVGDMAQIKVNVEGINLDGRSIDVVLRHKQEELAKQMLTIDAQPGPQLLTLSFVPKIKGQFTYVVSIDPDPSEKITINNQKKFNVSVVDAKIRVLFIEGTLRPEFRTLKGQYLAKDMHVEFCSLIRVRGNRYLQQTNMKGLKLTAVPTKREVLARFDVFLIGDVDSSHLRDQMATLRSLVKEGKGLGMLGGYHSFGPGGYGKTPLADVLPVQPGPRSVGQADEPFLPVVTPDGANHPLLANVTAYFPHGGKPPATPGLPLLRGCTRVTGYKTGAVVLMQHPKESGPSGRPLIVYAAHIYGKGRSVAFVGDTTWLWYQKMKGLGMESPYLKFWGQMIRYLAQKEYEDEGGPGDRVTVRLNKSYYKPGERARISARVRDADGRGVVGAKVVVEVAGPRRKIHKLDLAPTEGAVGNYEVWFPPPRAGTYSVDARATKDSAELGRAKTEFQVEKPSLEFDRLDLDERGLKRLASATKGIYVHVSKTEDLITGLEARLLERSGYREVDFYEGPHRMLLGVLWALLIVLITCEWLIRKKWQLH